MRGRRVDLVLIAPAAFAFLGLFALPQFGLLSESLSVPKPFGIAAYLRFLNDGFYLAMLARTVLTAAAVTVICVLVGFPLALWLARLESRLVPLLLLLVSAPLWISAVVRSFAWMVLFFRNGAVSSLVRATGLVGSDFQLMGTLAAVIIALAQVLLPLMVITVYGVIRSIDPRLEEAAINLGAGPAAAVWLVTIRLASDGILAGALLVFALGMGAFATPSLIGGAKAQLMAVAIQEQTLELLDWPFAAAISGILLAVSLLVAVAYGRLSSLGDRS